VDTLVVFHDIGLDRLVNSYRSPATVDRQVTYISCPGTRHTMDLDNITSSVLVTAGGSLTFQNLVIQVSDCSDGLLGLLAVCAVCSSLLLAPTSTHHNTAVSSCLAKLQSCFHVNRAPCIWCDIRMNDSCSVGFPARAMGCCAVRRQHNTAVLTLCYAVLRFSSATLCCVSPTRAPKARTRLIGPAAYLCCSALSSQSSLVL
jgi:hypothetical protein